MSWQIAIDGPAGAGKSTIAKELARKLGFEYIDTGAMYRAVTLKAINLKINMYEEEEYKFLDETKIDFINQRLFLDGVDVSNEIRSLVVSNNVSLVAKFGYVRAKLVALQQALANQKNVIMDGRDIGTVVLPNANLKIYLSAGVEERARRRMNERLEKNLEVQDLATTIKEIEERDFKDSNRPISPLAKAADAIEIDSSKLSAEKVVDEIIKLVLKRGYKMENLENKMTNLEEKEVKDEETSNVEPTPEVVKPKTTRKKTTKKAEEVVEETNEKDVEAVEVKPARKKATKKAEEVVEEPVVEDAAVEEKPARKKTTKKVEKVAEETVAEEKVAEVAEEKPAEEKVAEAAEEKPAEEKPAEEVVAEEPVVEDAAVEEKPAEEVVAETTEEKATEEVVEELEEDEEDDINSDDEEEDIDETEEEETPNEAIKYRELQVVEGTVVEVIDAKPEMKRGNRIIKAKEERVLIRLEDGQEGFLFRKDTVDIQDDEDLFDLFIEGDKVQVVIKKIYPDGGKFVFSTVLLKMRNDLKKYEEMIENHETFTAKVVRELSVGYLLKDDEFSCLLPATQVAGTEEEKANLVGQEIEVSPIRIDYGRIRVIVSQTVAYAIKKRAEKKAFLETLEVGQVFEGTVKNIESYGAFVEIANGIEGLLHISELDHNRVFKVERIVKPGDTVQVKVIRIENEHIGLSRKALIPNYWQEYVDAQEVGKVVEGLVLEINNYGVVIQLAENVTGFLPKSEFAYERDVFITDTVNVNDKIEAKIIEIDAHKKRIILSRKQLMENPWEKLNVKSGDTVETTVVKELKDGYKLDLQGAVGYLPKSNISNYNEPIIEGNTLKVRVRAFDPANTRLIFTLRVDYERVPREAYGKFMKSQDKLTDNFGDLLEKQLKNFKK